MMLKFESAELKSFTLKTFMLFKFSEFERYCHKYVFHKRQSDSGFTAVH